MTTASDHDPRGEAASSQESAATSGIVIRRVAERFPEPAFEALQREVFAGVQAASPQADRMLAAEQLAKDALPPKEKVKHAPMVRLGAYDGEQLIGWSLAWPERGDGFYMAHSGVVAAYRRRGIYTCLVQAVLALAREQGALYVRSQHSVLNNAVLIGKLKLGFQVSGLSTSAQLGLLVELTHHLSAERAEVFASRVIPFAFPRREAAPEPAPPTSV